MTLTRYQPTDPGYSFGANFRYWLIRESLIFATFSAVGMGVGLYASIYGSKFCCIICLYEMLSEMLVMYRLQLCSRNRIINVCSNAYELEANDENDGEICSCWQHRFSSVSLMQNKTNVIVIKMTMNETVLQAFIFGLLSPVAARTCWVGEETVARKSLGPRTGRLTDCVNCNVEYCAVNLQISIC